MIYQLRTLGGLDLSDADGREVRAILAQPKRLALLVYLTLAPDRFRRRDTLLALFWPEQDDEHARGALRQALRFIRRSLSDSMIVTRGEEEIGIAPGLLDCDAVALVAANAAGRHAEAVGLYRGDFLAGFFVSDAAPELDDLLESERGRLRALAAESAWCLAEEHRAAGEPKGASALARQATAFARDDEGAVARLIGFLDGLGDRAGAIAAYEALARRLQRDYGAEPSPETQMLIRRVRARTVAPDLPEAPAPPVGAPAEPPPAPAMTPGVGSERRTRPLLLAALAGLLAIGGYLVAFAGGSRPPRPMTVAVLPLENLSGDTSQSYLAEAMTDQLITDLAQVRGLQVINRRTMMAYRGTTRSAPEIARELHADAVLVAALQRAADSIRLTAQLVLADEEQAVWARSYDAARGNLLTLQREVARAVAERVEVALGPDERAGLARARAVDPAALDAYVRGRYWWNKRGRGNLLRAIDLFRKALDADPTFALAYSGMANAYAQIGYGGFLAPDDAFPKAAAAAQKALELDSTLAEPHAVLGYAGMYYDWDWKTADREFLRAIARNPSDATAHEWYGLFLAAMGRFDEAQAHVRRAQELDPLSPAVTGTAGWVLHYSGKQEEAKRVLKAVVRTDSAFEVGRLYLGRVYQAQGLLDSAIAEYEATGRLRGWIPTVAAVGYVYALQGKREDAQRVLRALDSLSTGEYVTPYAVALVHAALGQPDSAFVWLDRAVQERTHWLVWLNRDSRWRPLRGDPRFGALVRRVGLPP